MDNPINLYPFTFGNIRINSRLEWETLSGLPVTDNEAMSAIREQTEISLEIMQVKYGSRQSSEAIYDYVFQMSR